MAVTGAFGRYLDNPDELFMWINCAVMGVATVNLVNRAGITARLLEGPCSLEDLASHAQLPAAALARILDYLQAHEVIARSPDGHYHANARTPMLHVAAGYFANAETTATAASQLLPGLRQGRTPFDLQFGQPVFDYFAERPERSALFGRFMGFMTQRTLRFIFAQHRFLPFTTVADIGGSMGDLLLAVLAEYPGTRGILFDLPGTIDLARPVVAASPLVERVQLLAGSFFEAVPVADLYLLKQILHDWDDAGCREILGSIRRVIPAHGRLVAIEHVLADEPAPDEGQGTDIAMLILATGRERRLAEFTALFEATGFAIERVSRNPQGHSVIEVLPVD